MGIKTYNPYTPSRRQMTGSDFSEITKTAPEKSLVVSLSKNSGRNNQGKITVRHRGGGNRRKYRLVDFKRKKDGIAAKVIGIEYDPNRTANIALICYADGEKAYILAPACLCLLSRLVLWYTTSNCILEKADSWFVPQETAHRLWLKKENTQHCVCLQVK